MSWEFIRDQADRLTHEGLNLQAVLPTHDLQSVSPELWRDRETFPSLLLVGSSGGDLWGGLSGQQLLTDDPIDNHCELILTAFVNKLTQGCVRAQLTWHPGCGRACPVVALGERAGWSQRSRMGLGIHIDRGLWFAYRGLVQLALPAEGVPASLSPSAPGENPCVGCKDPPCVSQCPVGAVGGAGGVDLRACFDERERPEAPCASRCLSRLACPIGNEHQYSLAQIAHHHEHAKMPPGWRDQLPPSPPEWQEQLT